MQRFLEFIHTIAGRVQALAEGLGGPGLMMVAFIDSSFLTLPEVADILVVMFTIREPSRWWYFSGMTTLGSMMGSYVLFLIGRKGGEALLRRNRMTRRCRSRACNAFSTSYEASVLPSSMMISS